MKALKKCKTNDRSNIQTLTVANWTEKYAIEKGSKNWSLNYSKTYEQTCYTSFPFFLLKLEYLWHGELLLTIFANKFPSRSPTLHKKQWGNKTNKTWFHHIKKKTFYLKEREALNGILITFTWFGRNKKIPFCWMCPFRLEFQPRKCLSSPSHPSIHIRILNSHIFTTKSYLPERWFSSATDFLCRNFGENHRNQQHQSDISLESHFFSLEQRLQNTKIPNKQLIRDKQIIVFHFSLFFSFFVFFWTPKQIFFLLFFSIPLLVRVFFSNKRATSTSNRKRGKKLSKSCSLTQFEVLTRVTRRKKRRKNCRSVFGL